MKRARGSPGTVLALLIAPAVVGCVSHTRYPAQWASPEPAAQGACPNLAGRYRNDGELAPGTPTDICHPPGKFRRRGAWACDTDLGRNVGDLRSGDWVELRQPDTDTLIVVSSDPTVEPRELRRSHHDFRCSGLGLERQLRSDSVSLGDDADRQSAGLTIYNAILDSFGVMFGTVGVRTLTRRFGVAPDGSLVMTVELSDAGTSLLIPGYTHGDTFVRWARVPSPEPDLAGEAGAAPATSVGLPARTAAPLDSPAAHVGRFLSINAWLNMNKLWVQSVDGGPGASVDAAEGFAYRPVVMGAGTHRVELAFDGKVMSFSKYYTVRYAFDLPVEAGHAYRVRSIPAGCLPPGPFAEAVDARAVYRRRLEIVDESDGTPPREITVGALCTTGGTPWCGSALPPDGPAAPERAGTHCVRLEGADWGFSGWEPEAAPRR